MPDPTPAQDLAYVATASGFAGVCGALSYLLKIEEGKRFKWSEFILHTATSAAFGYIAYEALLYKAFPPEYASALCGVAGYLGTRCVRIAELVIKKKLGISDDKQPSD
jgi:hypothetical protein